MQLSTTFPSIEIADSYAISSAIADLKVARGKRLIGHKIGLTSKAMQASSQIDEPDYGHLFDDMLIQDGAKVRHADFCVPRVEPELTFVLKEPLKGPNVGLIDVLRATDYVVPSIEIIDARVQNPRKISIPSPITGPPRVWYSVGDRCGPRTLIFDGWAHCFIEMPRSKRPGSRRGCSATRQWQSLGWLISSRRSTSRSNPGT